MQEARSITRSSDFPQKVMTLGNIGRKKKRSHDWETPKILKKNYYLRHTGLGTLGNMGGGGGGGYAA